MLKFVLRYYLPINLLYDVFTSTLWQVSASSASIRGALLLLIILVAWLNNPRNPVYTPFVLYTIFIAVMLPFSSDIMESVRLSSKALTTLWAFPIFFAYSYLFTDKVIKNNIFLLSIILIANYVISTFFGIGQSSYTRNDEFLVGNLNDSWLIYTYVLFLFIIILKSKSIKPANKIIYLILFVLLAIQLILGLKRTAIGVFFIGIVIFLFLEKLNIKTIIIYILGFVAVILVLNQYSDILSERINARGDRLRGNYTDIIETEFRYLESIYVWRELLSFESISESLFGLEAYNSKYNYGTSNIFGQRVLHVDYNLIANTTGLIGLLFYFYLFFYIYQIFRRRKIYIDSVYKELFLIIFITQFIASIGGQMLSITYGSIKFAFLAISINKER